MNTQKVVLVDDNRSVLDALGEFLQMAAGVECLRFQGLKQLVDREIDVLNRGVVAAILDINLGQNQPSGIDVYHWLRNHDFPGKIAFLTAHAKDHPLVVQAGLIGGVKVFTKPMDAEALVSLIQEQSIDPPEQPHA